MQLPSARPQANTVVHPKGERGVALIMAMMIVALIATVAVEVSWRFELSMSRSANRWHGIQARQYLEGAEHLAMVVLKEDLENEDTSKADHLGEPWAQESAPFPTDHGYVSGRIQDAHGLFNINLMKPQPGTCPNGQPKQQGRCEFAQFPCDQFTKPQQIFVRLLQTFDLNQAQTQQQDKQAGLPEEEPVYLPREQAEQITEAVIDWLDEDSEISGFGGAESDYYGQLDTPITIANTEMVSVSELQVIRGMVPELFNQLVQHVIALPTDKMNRMNINTISPNIAQSIKTTERQSCDLDPYDAEVGQSLYSFIAGGEFTDWQEMKDDVGLPREWSNSSNEIIIPQELFGFGPSNYFILRSETGIGEDLIRHGLSLIYRAGGAATGGGNDGSGDGDGEDNRFNNDNGDGGRGGIQPATSQGPDIEVVRRTDAHF